MSAILRWRSSSEAIKAQHSAITPNPAAKRQRHLGSLRPTLGRRYGKRARTKFSRYHRFGFTLFGELGLGLQTRYRGRHALCGGLGHRRSRVCRAAGGGPAQGRVRLRRTGGRCGVDLRADQARKALVAEFGTKIATSFVENVPEGADAERVMRDLVSQGNQLIFGTTFGYMEPMLKVASDAKQVKFEHATGYKSSGNMRTYDSRTYEGAYMVGVIAGSMTKSNMLGVVASIPIPEVIRNIDSFTLGARA